MKFFDLEPLIVIHACILGAKFTSNTESWVGHVVEHTVVLLLHVGDHVQHRVHVVRRRRHRQARDAAGGAVYEGVVRRQCHVHAGEHKRYGWCNYRDRVACVKPSEPCHGEFLPDADSPPELVPDGSVGRFNQPGEHRTL